MSVLLAAVDWLHYLFTIPLSLLSIFLTLVILVQRGRGGGLTGALGGMGGQSAFGTKAGDLFTRITIIVAALWVLLSMAALKVLNERSATAGFNPAQRGVTAPVEPDEATGGKANPERRPPASGDAGTGSRAGGSGKSNEAAPAPAAATEAGAQPGPSPDP